jgi:hypothetical protein
MTGLRRKLRVRGFVAVARMFRVRDQFARTTSFGPGRVTAVAPCDCHGGETHLTGGDETASGDKHPTSAANGQDPVGPDAAANTDDERVASTGAQVCDPRSSGEFGAAEHASGVGRQHFVHGPLLRSQMLEGVSIRRPVVDSVTLVDIIDTEPGVIRRSGPCHALHWTRWACRNCSWHVNRL